MGSLKIGDKIIVTDALTIPQDKWKYIGSVATIIEVDQILVDYLYKVKLENRHLWVDGVLYSPLLEELF